MISCNARKCKEKNPDNVDRLGKNRLKNLMIDCIRKFTEKSMIPVEGHKNLYREESGAIVNTDTNGYANYMRAKIKS